VSDFIIVIMSWILDRIAGSILGSSAMPRRGSVEPRLHLMSIRRRQRKCSCREVAVVKRSCCGAYFCEVQARLDVIAEIFPCERFSPNISAARGRWIGEREGFVRPTRKVRSCSRGDSRSATPSSHININKSVIASHPVGA
jgi:hypothetical protein